MKRSFIVSISTQNSDDCEMTYFPWNSEGLEKLLFIFSESFGWNNQEMKEAYKKLTNDNPKSEKIHNSNTKEKSLTLLLLEPNQNN
jgi:hypothetical protein